MMKRVLYIAGTRRTGSTVLDILLGSAASVCSTGQLAFLHKRDTCACGRTLPDCLLWGEVLSSPHVPDKRTLHRLGGLTKKEVGLPVLLASTTLCQRYASAHDRVLDAVFEASGADVLVDSSKNVARALALLRSSEHEIYVLHLVRDPRGFIGSLRRRNRKHGTSGPWPPRLMAEWVLKQGAASTLLQSLAQDRYRRIHYEDLLLHPERTLEDIAQFIAIDVSETVNRIQNERPFRPGHIFSGNPVARKERVVFDASRVRSNRLRERSNDVFWYTIGWPSALWGYDRQQTYLDDVPELAAP